MRILQENSLALLIDIQERLMPAMAEGPKTLAAAVKFIKGLQILEIPILAVRQYPQGLGDLVPEVREALGEAYKPLDKRTFSAGDDPAIAEHLKACGKKNILVFGTEAHVCVLQSVIDLAALGYTPVLVCDCIDSRSPFDKKIAIRRAEKEGAFLTTSEAILFELMRTSGTETFKRLSALIK